MQRKILALALLFLFSTGAAQAQCSAAQVPVRVFLMYGLVSNVLSSGMHDLMVKMNRVRNVNATVHEWVSIPRITSEAAESKSAIVIGGHSIGANSAVSAAAQLEGKRRVALLLGFDPSSLAPLQSVPSNVVRAIAFRQEGNPFGGNPFTASSRSTSIQDVFRQMGHVEVDKHPAHHATAIRAVCNISTTR